MQWRLSACFTEWLGRDRDLQLTLFRRACSGLMPQRLNPANLWGGMHGYGNYESDCN